MISSGFVSKLSANFAKLILVLAVLISLTSCSTTKVKSPNLSTTAIGAMTGAAIGGGVGLLLGSTGGNAGEGFAIGSVAGAALGGAIGHQLESKEKKSGKDSYDDEEEALLEDDLNSGSNLSSKKKVAKNQGKGQFKIPSSNKPSAKKGQVLVRTSPAKNSSSAFVKKQSPTLAKSTQAQKSKNGSKEARAKLATSANTSSAKISTPPRTSTKEVATRPEAKMDLTNSAEALSATEPMHRAEKESLGAGLPPAAKQSETFDEDSLVQNSGNPPTTSVIATKQVTKAKAETPACVEAETEAKRAKSAASDADRLFYLRRALRLCPDEASYHVEAGKVYSSIGRSKDAKNAYQKALEVDPANQEAQEELSILQLGKEN